MDIKQPQGYIDKNGIIVIPSTCWTKERIVEYVNDVIDDYAEEYELDDNYISLSMISDEDAINFAQRESEIRDDYDDPIHIKEETHKLVIHLIYKIVGP